MLKNMPFLAALAGALLVGTVTMSSEAKAWRDSGTWEGPRGATVHWNERVGPHNYRNAVTVTTPNGKTYKRVTRVHQGPNGWYATRRWSGPNGSGGRAWGRRY